ncbi:hypothetical protein C8R45DRAFT_787153, partial [Mycena sanguinolenta]
SECEIYTNQLMRRKRGFPLYVPGPPENLPQEYQDNGIQIGDVGTVTPEGLFDVLFNIYLPADHPVNINNVPSDFHPLPKYNVHRDIVKIRHDPGNYVSTSLVHKVIPNAPFVQYPGNDFIFNCRPPQGAVLALPHGGELRRLNLKAVQAVRDYARTQAENWYANITGADNGSLYLVTGCEKAMSWGLASYHSTQDGDEFQASFRPIQPNDDNPQYQWMGSGRFPAQHKHYNRPASISDIWNQTVFIHGFCISIR